MNDRLVINVFSLIEFRTEIPSGDTVWLSQTESRRPDDIGLPFITINLDLQAVNLDYQVIWLHYEKELGCKYTFSPQTKKFYEQLGHMKPIVHDHLKQYHYRVRSGRLVLPKNLKPASGIFECLGWSRENGFYAAKTTSPPFGGERGGEEPS